MSDTGWNRGDPPTHGYYLAAHGRRVSELWFNESTGWWTSRGYLHRGGHSTPVIGVYAWRPMPGPPEDPKR